MGRKLKELLGQGKLTRVFCMGQLCSPKIIEMVGIHGGFDAVWLDQEHAGLTIELMEHAARAARGCGLDVFVRLAPTDYATVMRPLEAGANGVMAAQVRSAAQAQEVVRWAKFHPHGLRGVNGTGYDGAYGSLPLGEYLRQANSQVFVAIQIEHIEALEEVESIAAIPEIDVLFIGPADLSQSMAFRRSGITLAFGQEFKELPKRPSHMAFIGRFCRQIFLMLVVVWKLVARCFHLAWMFGRSKRESQASKRNIATIFPCHQTH